MAKGCEVRAASGLQPGEARASPGAAAEGAGYTGPAGTTDSPPATWGSSEWTPHSSILCLALPRKRGKRYDGESQGACSEHYTSTTTNIMTGGSCENRGVTP